MSLEERIIALEASIRGARKAYHGQNERISRLEGEVNEYKEKFENQRTLLVDIRGKDAVDLHESYGIQSDDTVGSEPGDFNRSLEDSWMRGSGLLKG